MWYSCVVESTDLAAFYRSVSSWPTSEAELGIVASELAKLIEVPFIALYALDLENGVERLGLNHGARAEPEEVKELIRAQLALMPEGDSLSPRSLQNQRERIGSHVTIQSISSELKISSNPRDSRLSHQFGCVVVGSEKTLSSKDEILLMAAVQRLAELAEVSRFERMLGMRSQFLSIASHELKTPLTAIYGILQLQERMLRLKRQEAEVLQPDKQHSYLKMVIRQVERLNELIDGLLDVSRIQNGRFMCEPSDSDAVVVLNEGVTSRLNVIAGEAGVSIHIDSPAQLKAWIDPVRFEEVVTNLVMNGIRFSPEGGIVRVKLREEPNGFKLIVKDQGPPIAPEDRERVFQPFERAQRTARLGGLGLGLFISRQIAQLHQGTVTLLESLPGQGNTIEAFFPNRASLHAISA